MLNYNMFLKYFLKIKYLYSRFSLLKIYFYNELLNIILLSHKYKKLEYYIDMKLSASINMNI